MIIKLAKTEILALIMVLFLLALVACSNSTTSPSSSVTSSPLSETTPPRSSNSGSSSTSSSAPSSSGASSSEASFSSSSQSEASQQQSSISSEVSPSSNPKEGAPDTQQWVEALKEARGIDDFSDYSAAIYELNEQIESSLEDTQYGGTGQIREVFTDEKTNETTILTIGLKIFYIDIDKVKPVVTKIESNFTSAGKIDIEYINCKYTLNELKEFAKEIQTQDFFEKYVSALSVYEGKVYARVKEGSKHLENFINDKPYKDAVVLRSESTEINPAT